ncbi:plasma membrane protein Pth11-like protein [Emericellopsis cladophorae]|uniref:Plasma membrane protein Pth11-like protein n=1 Tax=Emericellopsis cladophorae TaxID=2686198 RepID=A0A9Q0BH57_9HYPO|nr:plasma membrane protein Pth11-like protein [Emericellopsis cladophorae]KAI6784069.1 plasma membrane protein Pth11-like protein [Emericellopsis cladophorae]
MSQPQQPGGGPTPPELVALAPQAYYQKPEHLLAASIAFIVLTPVCVALRFGIRRWQGSTFRMDDWLLVPATALTIAMSVLVIHGVRKGAVAYRLEFPQGFTANPLTLATDQTSLMARTEYGFTIMLPLALGCSKLSFLFFYHRIFAVDRKGAISWFLRALMVLMVLWSIAFCFGTIFECGTDFGVIWGPTMAMVEKCVDTMLMIYAFCISDFITDAIIILIPVPLIWKLQLPRAKKLATSAIFLLGAGTLGASFCRLYFTAQAVNVGFDPTQDEILTITLYLYWGLVESGVAIVAACLPSLSFIFKASSVNNVVGKSRTIFSSSSSRKSLHTTNSGAHYERTADMKHSLHDLDSHSDDSDIGLQGRAHVEDSSRNSREPIMDDAVSAVSALSAHPSLISNLSRGSNRLEQDPRNFDSYTTDSSWRTRGPSVPDVNEEFLAPPPPSHHTRDFRGSPV